MRRQSSPRLAACMVLALMASTSESMENAPSVSHPLAARVEKILAPLSRQLDFEALPWGGAAMDKSISAVGAVYEAGCRATRREAEDELVSLGREVTPVLTEMLKKKDDNTARSIAYALGEIGDSSAEPVLVEAMNDSRRSLEVRVQCAVALAKWKKDVGGALLVAGLRLSNELASISRCVRNRCSVQTLKNVVALESLQNGAVALRNSVIGGLRAILNRDGNPLSQTNGNGYAELAWEAEKRWAEANKPTWVTGFVVDPWGYEARYRDQIGARNGHRSVVDRLKQAAIAQYVELAMPAEAMSRVVRSLVEARAMIEPVPSDHPNSAKYSLIGSVKVSDKVLEYLWDKQAQKWDYVGLTRVGIDH